MSATIRRQQLLKLYPFPVLSKQPTRSVIHSPNENQMKNFQLRITTLKHLEMMKTQNLMFQTVFFFSKRNRSVGFGKGQTVICFLKSILHPSILDKLFSSWTIKNHLGQSKITYSLCVSSSLCNDPAALKISWRTNPPLRCQKRR